MISDPGALASRFSVLYDASISASMLEVDLLDAGGTVCAFNFTNEQDVVAHEASTFVNDFLVWDSRDCPLPKSTSTLKATLLTLRDVGGPYLERTEYFSKSFAVGYAFERYPPPPANAPPSVPRIAELEWRVNLPTAGDPPIPGDPTTTWCKVSDADGDAVTVTLALTWTRATPRRVSESFPPGASSSSEGASLSLTTDAGNPPTATFTCRVVDARGNSATRTATIP